MNLTFDRHLFTQIGLDSGCLTMLGTVVHSFGQPGEYRGVVHEGPEVKAVFTISVDPHSPDAQVSIDLSSLVEGTGAFALPDAEACCKAPAPSPAEPGRFTINPRGYALFHVMQGAGGYYLHIRRTDAEQKDKGYDSRLLADGDVFTAIVLRPGSYALFNECSGAKGQLTVAYPRRRDAQSQSPTPVRVVCSKKGFEPDRLQIDPGQGVIFECHTTSRIHIKLEKPDDGPGDQGRPDGSKRPRDERKPESMPTAR